MPYMPEYDPEKDDDKDRRSSGIGNFVRGVGGELDEFTLTREQVMAAREGQPG